MLMQSISKSFVKRNIAILVAVLCILVGGAWITIKITTDHFLYQDATSTAKSWARSSPPVSQILSRLRAASSLLPRAWLSYSQPGNLAKSFAM
jgi:hypothetical protein